MVETIAIAIGKAGDVAVSGLRFDRPQQLTKRDVSFAAHDKVDARNTGVGVRRKTGIVSANDDADVGLH